MRPFLLVLSSPSGGGKSTIAKHLLAARDDLAYSVSATTRAPRPGETDGVEYHFLSDTEFRRRETAGDFVETASYGGHRYGTLREEIDRSLAEGRHVVLDIEVAGARQIRQAFPEAVLVFILPPSVSALLERLRGRKTEDGEALRRRLDHAAEELASVSEYDYLVVNDDLVTAVDRVAAILDAESHRISRRATEAGLVERLRAEVEAYRTQVVAG